jgi:hypothetical protein
LQIAQLAIAIIENDYTHCPLRRTGHPPASGIEFDATVESAAMFSAAMIVVIPAIVPSVLVIIAVMVTIVVALAIGRPCDDTG